MNRTNINDTLRIYASLDYACNPISSILVSHNKDGRQPLHIGRVLAYVPAISKTKSSTLSD